MQKLRLLVVDDAVVVRALLVKLFSSDPQLEVVGVAASGRIALALLARAPVDVVILDVDMPDMDGMETLTILRHRHPGVAVVMFSALTERGAAITLDALALGAVDYYPKPAHLGSASQTLQLLRDELIPKIKAVAIRRSGDERGEAGALATPLPLARPLEPVPTTKGRPDGGDAAALGAPPRPRAGLDVVAIGASTGGPNALAELLPALPASFPLPILIVQHMPPIFTKLLAERLGTKSAVRVVEASDGDVLEPGQAYVAPGNYHMIVARGETSPRPLVRLHQGPHENSCRPAADVLFRSVAQVYPGRALAVVLTGMGQDGSRGSAAIRESGGQVLAQDEASSVVWGMPRIVVDAGLADKVLPLERMAMEIVRRASEGRSRAGHGLTYAVGT